MSIPDSVLTLVEQSLLQSREDESEELRFYLLETVREFAREALRQSPHELALRRAHCEYFLALAEAAAPELSGPQQREWLSLLEGEQANLRAAINYAIEVEACDLAYRLGTALRPFWAGRGYIAEAVQQMERLQLLPVLPAFEAYRLKLLQALAAIYFYIPLFTEATEILQELLRAWRQREDYLQLAQTLNHLSWSVKHLGQYRAAIQYAEEALTLGVRLNDQHVALTAHNNLGWVKMAQGRPREARRRFDQTISITHQLEDDRRNGYALTNQGSTLRLLGQYENAVDLLQQALTIHRRNKDKILIGYALSELGYTWAITGEIDQAEAVCAEILLQARESGGGIFLYDQTYKIQTIVALTKRDFTLAQAQADQLRAINKKFIDGIRRVTALHILAYVAYFTDQRQQALALAKKAIELDRNRDSYAGSATGLQLIGYLLILRGDTEAGVHLLGQVAAIRKKVQMPLPPWECPLWDQVVATATQALGETTYAAAFAQGQHADETSMLEFALRISSKAPSIMILTDLMCSVAEIIP